MTNQIFVSIHLTLQSLISQVTDGIWSGIWSKNIAITFSLLLDTNIILLLLPSYTILLSAPHMHYIFGRIVQHTTNRLLPPP
jgi:hypothetical protein